MATFVLVPGAWLGGWAWQRVTPLLRAAGHVVYPATLTGLGERVHLARPDVDLDTHITDVVNLMEYEDLGDVVLVGHSYAGAVITGVADRSADRLAQLVYLDTAPFEDGETVLEFNPPDEQERMTRQVDGEGDGWRLAFPDSLEQLGPPDITEGLGDGFALIRAKAAPQPFGTYTRPLRLSDTGEPTYERVVIACNGLRGLVAAGMPRIAALTRAPWRYHDLPGGHWPMLSSPKELADLLDVVSHDASSQRRHQ